MSCNSFESVSPIIAPLWMRASTPLQSCSSRSIERVDSGDTENSAFSSNLVTPTDEDVYLKSGIEERLEISHGVLDYFATGTGSALEEMEGVDQLRLNKVKDITDGKKTTVSHLGELTTVDLVTGVGNELDVVSLMILCFVRRLIIPRKHRFSVHMNLLRVLHHPCLHFLLPRQDWLRPKRCGFLFFIRITLSLNVRL